MNPSRLFLLLLLALLVAAGISQVQKGRAMPVPQDSAVQDGAGEAAPEPQFLRFVDAPERGTAELETAIVTYEDGAGRRVDLVGAVHIGDAGYYELLNHAFRGYDAVLYEMVKPADMEVGARVRHGDSPVSNLQRFMKDLLELEFQLDGIDYRAANFVHADLDVDSFFRLQKERGESLVTLMLQAMLTEYRATTGDAQAEAMPLAMMLAALSKDRARHMKLVLGRQFGDIERLAAGFERGLKGGESVLVVERNKAALAVLDKQFDKGHDKLAIFYGAAHLPDFERRLLARGFRRTTETWLTAWHMERTRVPEQAPVEGEG